MVTLQLNGWTLIFMRATIYNVCKLISTSNRKVSLYGVILGLRSWYSRQSFSQLIWADRDCWIKIIFCNKPWQSACKKMWTVKDCYHGQVLYTLNIVYLINVRNHYFLVSYRNRKTWSCYYTGNFVWIHVIKRVNVYIIKLMSFKNIYICNITSDQAGQENSACSKIGSGTNQQDLSNCTH